MNQKRPIPRVAAIHDLSSFGRCALTVIIPTLSALGVQVVPIPTALLSTHTGGFTDMSFLDLNAEMQKIDEHFRTLGLEFDAVYTGFLGSHDQIETVSRFIEHFGKTEGCRVFVDPVMGDDGRLYSTYTPELVEGMKHLSASADIITPNLTEACLLTDTPYPEAELDRAAALSLGKSLCHRLFELYGCDVVLTGLPVGERRIANCTLSGGRFAVCEGERVGRNYPGTGDLFASVMLGKLLSGEDFDASANEASHFVRRAVELSETLDVPTREGVVFEALLKEI